MKKATQKTNTRSKGARKAKISRQQPQDQGWYELEAQADRLKYDWMSLSVQLGIADNSESSFK